jgi:hypothetical protein
VVLVGGPPRVALTAEELLEHLLRHEETGLGQELPPGADGVAGQVRGDDVLGAGGQLIAVLDQAEQRWLVRDHGADPLRMGLGEGEHAHRAAAGAERHGRPGVEVLDQPREVTGSQLGGGVAVRVVHRAAVDAARVGGEHGVVGGEQVGQRRERLGVHRRADQHHERAVAPDFVVQLGVRHAQCRSRDSRRVVHGFLLVNAVMWAFTDK